MGNLNENEFPIRPLSNKLMLYLEISELYMNNDAMTFSGSQMIVHSVDEYPFEEKNSFTLLDQTSSVLVFDPVVFEADDSLKSTTPQEYHQLNLYKPSYALFQT
jgi:hypothetical protein